MPTTDTTRTIDTRTPHTALVPHASLAPRASDEGRPIPASDAATRGESRGAARMNSTAPETPRGRPADGMA